MAQDVKTGQGTGNGPMDRLKAEASSLVTALGDRAMSSVRDKVEDATGRLTEYMEGGAGPGFMAAVTGVKGVAEGKGPVRSALGAGFKGATEKVKGVFGKGGKGGGGKGKKLKVTNIVESIDVGVPIDLAYNQWTQFTDFPSFMKQVENVDQVEDEKLHWRAQVLWSHREWDADIIEQIPDERIVWRSEGQKGHVDGAVTFHELAPDMTRILLVLEYHPQGFFEYTGNLWRAQGRRARLELKHFRRHLMTNAILHPEEIEGWRGVIEDGEVVQDDEAARAEEERGGDEAEGREQDDELADEAYAEDRGEDVEDEDLDDEGVDDEGVDDEGVEDEYQVPDAEDEDVSPNGQAARERLARTTGGSSPAGRGRRPTGRQQGSSRSSREEGRPQRPVRRRAGTRGGNSQ
jgi:uncharacterized membrane protein